jgi:hypothetical protein
MTKTKRLDLAMPKRPRGRPWPAAQEKFEAELTAWCDGINLIASGLDFDVGSRGWCYILEEHGLSKGDFDSAQHLINDCRKDGHLPLDICCEDERRAAENLDELDADPKARAQEIIHYVDRAEHSYYPHSFWQTQDTYVEMAVEKSDLKSLFSSVCDPFHIPLLNFAGWSDLHSRAAMMERFEYWERRGKRCVLLYCGDHDPGGLHITDFIRGNLEAMSGAIGGWMPDDLEIERFGLNASFINRHRLTWIENLDTSSGKSLADRSHNDHAKDYVQNYIKEFGVRKVEANALVSRPEAGRNLCRQTILKYLPADAPEQYQSSLRLPRRKLKAEIKLEIKRLIKV